VAPKTILKLWQSGAQPAKAAPKAAAGAVKKPAKAAAKPAVAGTPVMLIGDDDLRLKRARAALEARGFKIAGTATPDPEALGQLARKKSQAVIIDLGRRAPAGLELAGAIARSQFKDLPLFFAGARDASAERQIKTAVPSMSGCARVPPGDDEFIDLVVKKLSRKR
jgi:CheY-like chemotaxis protein